MGIDLEEHLDAEHLAVLEMLPDGLLDLSDVAGARARLDELMAFLIPAYAAPARATDLGGLPPAVVTVGSLDMFLDEDIDYAQALLAAGVACELHVYPGAFHGSSSLVPDADVSCRWHRDEMAALDRALNG